MAPAPDAPDRILRIVRSQPGVPVSKLRTLSGLGWGALYHQLKRMEAAGLVRTVRSRRRALVLPGESEEPDDVVRARALLAHPAVAAVARAIADGGARDVPTLAAACGARERVTYHHVKRLRECGLVSSSHPARHENLVATPRLLHLLWDEPPGEPGP